VPDERWLTPEQRKAWVVFVLASGAVMEGLERHLKRTAGLAHSHFAILQVVSQAPDATIRMSEAAAALRYSPSRLSHAVGRLERDGWLERRPDPDDGRGQLVSLTEDAHRRIQEVAPAHIREVRARVFDHLSPEQVGQLIEISEALLDGAPPPGPATGSG
jgi:DNA-binding MarR family transcriptional regulator